jgi:transcriptional regulator with XRE-family HTH domain
MRKWREIRRKVGLESLGKGFRTASTASMWLAELRGRAGVTQVDLAARLGVSQSRISRIEDEPDIRVSTIASYVAALGGTLRFTATLPGGQELRLDEVPPDEADSAARAEVSGW